MSVPHRVKRAKKPPVMPPWYALDHAAVIYPPTMSDRSPAFFRIQATLDRPVNAELLAKAMRNIAPRFPYYHVELRRGFFWFYFEKNELPLKPIVDSAYPMQKPEAGRRGAHLYRVRAYNDRLALEVSHVITDGGGGFILFKTLLGEYYRLRGVDVPYTDGIWDPKSAPEPHEWEDSFAAYSEPGTPVPVRQGPAYHVPGRLLPKGHLRVTTGRLSVAALLAVCKAHSATMTEYLTALLFSVLQDMQEEERGGRSRFGNLPLRIEIPADMRKIFPSRTMRNFSLFLEPTLDTRLQSFSLDEIIRSTRSQMALGLFKGELLRIVTRNVEAARSIFIRALPLPIKNVFMRFLSSIFGDRMFSSVLSNVGPIRFPEAVAKRIRLVDVLVNTSPVIKQAVGIISFGDSLSITFGSLCERSDVERRFFRRLVKDGIPVKIESNDI
jgi:hypothetical protein